MANIPVRIGIIGAGGIVKSRHLPGFAKIDDCQVVAVHNRRRANAEAVAKEWKIPNVVDSAEAVYGSSDVNAVLVGTTPYLHRDLTLRALEAGKHVFCQARMARNLAEAREMQAAARAHPKQVTMICPAPHVDVGDRLVRKIIQSGELGELRLLRLHQLAQSNLSADAPFHWRMDREVSGHNVLTMGMFAEILNRWVGPPRTVSAIGSIFTGKRRDPETGDSRDVKVPETVTVSGQLASGAHYDWSISGVTAFAPADGIEIYGTRGTLHYDLQTHRVSVGKADPSKQPRPGRVTEREAPTPVEIPADLRGEWTVEADFVAAIRDGKPVYPSFDDGVAYMEIVEAIARSIAEERVIRLPLA
ncbi:MAG TPA: Gfo/Idh/MocA family oxidoreductase [Candidatus Limnocylindrales bacterium]|nr:Gfo/Idh/MocA family oxidoreductase [Candidatus Limnocylindrales bacterium]